MGRLGPSSPQDKLKTKPRPLKTHPRQAKYCAEVLPEPPEVDPVMFLSRIFERRKKRVPNSLQKTIQDRPRAPRGGLRRRLGPVSDVSSAVLALSWACVGLKRVQDGPRRPPGSPRESPESPRQSQESHRLSQDGFPGLLGALLGSRGDLLGFIGALLGSLGVLLDFLGALLGSLGLSWGSLGALLGVSWGSLGFSWAFLGLSWGSLRLSWGSHGVPNLFIASLSHCTSSGLVRFLGLEWAWLTSRSWLS